MRRFWLFFAIVFCLAGALCFGQTPTMAFVLSVTPSPTCQPTHIYDAEVVFSVEEYKPDVSFTATLLGTNDQDWPTTPLGYSWSTSIPSMGSFIGDQTIEVSVPSPGPDSVIVGAYCSGSGLYSYCPVWSSQYRWATINRFDYVPTPTPTPIPPTPTPYCTPHEFSCIDGIISPVHLSLDNPTTVVLEHGGVEFLGLETIGGVPVPVTSLGNNQYLAEDLEYDSSYMWYFIGDYYSSIPPCEGDPFVCMSLFKTMPEPTPTATPSPTPVDKNAWVVSKAE